MGDCVTLVNQHSWDCYCTLLLLNYKISSFLLYIIFSLIQKVNENLGLSESYLFPWQKCKEQREKKDDGTICTIDGSDSKGERQGKGETSTCLMAIGDITYTNNEAEDDNIFCMMSVFVKAVLTQQDGTLNHPHALDVRMR